MNTRKREDIIYRVAIVWLIIVAIAIETCAALAGYWDVIPLMLLMFIGLAFTWTCVLVVIDRGIVRNNEKRNNGRKKA